LKGSHTHKRDGFVLLRFVGKLAQHATSLSFIMQMELS
jgi:hypothetical protein